MQYLVRARRYEVLSTPSDNKIHTPTPPVLSVPVPVPVHDACGEAETKPNLKAITHRADSHGRLDASRMVMMMHRRTRGPGKPFPATTDSDKRRVMSSERLELRS